MTAAARRPTFCGKLFRGRGLSQMFWPFTTGLYTKTALPFTPDSQAPLASQLLSYLICSLTLSISRVAILEHMVLVHDFSP